MTEKELQDAIAVAQAAYTEKKPTGTEAELKTLSDAIKTARQALSDFISSGANNCPACGNAPIGMVVRETQEGKVYEVGCAHCSPVLVDKDGKEASDITPTEEITRVSFSARGFLPQLAVQNWNDKKYLRDKKL